MPHVLAIASPDKHASVCAALACAQGAFMLAVTYAAITVMALRAGLPDRGAHFLYISAWSVTVPAWFQAVDV